MQYCTMRTYFVKKKKKRIIKTKQNWAAVLKRPSADFDFETFQHFIQVLRDFRPVESHFHSFYYTFGQFLVCSQIQDNTKSNHAAFIIILFSGSVF